MRTMRHRLQGGGRHSTGIAIEAGSSRDIREPCERIFFLPLAEGIKEKMAEGSECGRKLGGVFAVLESMDGSMATTNIDEG